MSSVRNIGSGRAVDPGEKSGTAARGDGGGGFAAALDNATAAPAAATPVDAANAGDGNTGNAGTGTGGGNATPGNPDAAAAADAATLAAATGGALLKDVAAHLPGTMGGTAGPARHAAPSGSLAAAALAPGQVAAGDDPPAAKGPHGKKTDKPGAAPAVVTPGAIPVGAAASLVATAVAVTGAALPPVGAGVADKALSTARQIARSEPLPTGVEALSAAAAEGAAITDPSAPGQQNAVPTAAATSAAAAASSGSGIAAALAAAVDDGAPAPDASGAAPATGPDAAPSLTIARPDAAAVAAAPPTPAAPAVGVSAMTVAGLGGSQIVDPAAAPKPMSQSADDPAGTGMMVAGNAATPTPLADAPTGTAAPAAPATLGDSVSRQVMGMIAAGGHEATLRLHPPELGDLTVRVVVAGRDVSAWFGSPQPQVQQAISHAFDQLRSDLGGAGYNLTGAWVGADSSGMQRRPGAAPPPPAAARTAPSVPGVAATGAASPTLPASSRVSVYV